MKSINKWMEKDRKEKKETQKCDYLDWGKDG